MILGLDASTATVGAVILDDNGDIVYKDYLSMGKIKEITEKGEAFEKYVQTLAKKYPITHVFIEEYAQKMSRGSSSAYTITRLAAFNGICQFICKKTFKTTPELLNCTIARKSCGIKTQSKKKAGKPVKDQVFDWVHANIISDFPTKVLSSGPRKGTQVFLKEASDISDAWVIARAGWLIVKAP
jgi:hypothetical protein